MRRADQQRGRLPSLARGMVLGLVLALALAGAARAAAASTDPPPTDPPPVLAADPASKPAADTGSDRGEFKFTLGRYRLASETGSFVGTDLNLRWRRDGRNLWLGVYQDRAMGREFRAGYDDQWVLRDDPVLPVQLQPSLQLASGGFVGGSLSVQVGSPFYAQVGIGRTNLRPYANLNFDPNDAVSAALGWQGAGGRQLQLLVIADDRLGTAQQHHHLMLRWPLLVDSSDPLRLTLDLLHKQGLGDTGAVSAWGWTLGLDGKFWFARLARDPKQNFSAQDAWRMSAGRRF